MAKMLKNINYNNWLKNDQFKEKHHLALSKVCQALLSPHFYPQVLWKTVEKSKR